MFQILRWRKGKKATGYDGAPGNLPKVLGQDVFKLMAQMINNMYDTDADCTQVTMTALKKKPKVTKRSKYHTISKDSSGT